MDENNKYILPFPFVVRIEPAASCNFKCIHCPTGLDMSPTGIMTLETFNKIEQELQDIIITRGKLFRVIVLYHGGEPLLNKHFFEMVRRTKPLASMVKTVTNGSRLTDEVIDEIIRSGLEQIEISLDGTSAQENDHIRLNPVGASFTTISASVKKLIHRKNELNSATPLIFISNTQIPETIEQVQDQPKPPQFMLDVFQDVAQGITAYKSAWALVWPGLPIQVSGQPDENMCDHVINRITIRSNGDVVPCCYDLVNKMPMGNVHSERLVDIWNNKQYQNLRKDIAEYDPPELCIGCPVLYKFKPMLKSDIFPEKC